MRFAGVKGLLVNKRSRCGTAAQYRQGAGESATPDFSETACHEWRASARHNTEGLPRYPRRFRYSLTTRVAHCWAWAPL
jgi:hypothetical protein